MYVWIVIGVAVVGLLAWIARPRPAFVLRIEDGGVTVVRGRVPPGFVSDCERICADCRITTGAILGYPDEAGTRLRFGPGIGPGHEQRFRNAWQIHA